MCSIPGCLHRGSEIQNPVRQGGGVGQRLAAASPSGGARQRQRRSASSSGSPRGCRSEQLRRRLLRAAAQPRDSRNEQLRWTVAALTSVGAAAVMFQATEGRTTSREAAPVGAAATDGGGQWRRRRCSGQQLRQQAGQRLHSRVAGSGVSDGQQQ